MAQLLDHSALPAKLIESGAGCGRIGDLVVDVEDILPGLALYRTGFYLAQVGIVFGEHLERGDQGSGAVLDRKGNADFVGDRVPAVTWARLRIKKKRV